MATLAWCQHEFVAPVGGVLGTSGPQIKRGGHQVKCGEINYSPQKIPPLKWPRKKEKRI